MTCFFILECLNVSCSIHSIQSQRNSECTRHFFYHIALSFNLVDFTFWLCFVVNAKSLSEYVIQSQVPWSIDTIEKGNLLHWHTTCILSLFISAPIKDEAKLHKTPDKLFSRFCTKNTFMLSEWNTSEKGWMQIVEFTEKERDWHNRIPSEQTLSK